MPKWAWVALIVGIVLLTWQDLAGFAAGELNSAQPGLKALGISVSGFTILAAFFIRLSHKHVDHGNTMFWSSLALGAACVVVPGNWERILNVTANHVGPLLDAALGRLGG
jgi:hypothetical protein